MTAYRFGDVVLVPFPFTDQSDGKKRPAVVVSSAAFHQERWDLILMAITSQFRPKFAIGESAIADWEGAGLLKPSVLKPVLFTLDKKLILKRLGALRDQDLKALRQSLQTILGIGEE